MFEGTLSMNNDRYFSPVGTKYCEEIESDFEIVKSDYFLAGESLIYRRKNETSIHNTPPKDLLINPKIEHAVGHLYRIIKEV